jgi:hypothetical protein
VYWAVLLIFLIYKNLFFGLVRAAHFHPLKKWLGRPDWIGFELVISSQMWLTRHFVARRFGGMGMS